MPYFSVIIPSFNRAPIINRAVQGVLDQTFQDFEILIVDDGSSDNTKEILQAFTSDNRIKYIFQNNAGVCSARNTGAKQATAEFLVFLDSDDTVEKSWLEDFYHLAIQNKHWLFCSMKIVKPDSREYLVSALDPYKNGKIKGNSIPGSWAIRKDIFFKVGMFDENVKFGENVELRFRLDKEKLALGIIDKYNFTYFESIDGGSRNLINKIDSNLYIIKKHSVMLNKNSKLLMLYYQNIAVSYAKLKNWNRAAVYFWKAYKVNIFNFKLLLSFIISLFPFLALRVWKV
jgi:glycosyltransferase involved in cell wall biosynthesis